MAADAPRRRASTEALRHRRSREHAPGTLAAGQQASPPAMAVLGYGPDGPLHEGALAGPAGLAELRGRWPVLWLDIAGPAHGPTLQALGQVFGLHPLALEDVQHAWQRPKAVSYDGHLFMVARMAPRDGGPSEQLSLFLGPDWLVTWQERPGDGFDAVRKHLRAGRGPLRRLGAGYLAWALLDALLDDWYPEVDRCARVLEDLERRVGGRPSRRLLETLHAQRRELLELLKAVRPLREVLAALERGDHGLVGDEARPFLRDCQDHLALLVEAAESQRELAAGLLDLSISVVSQRLNEIMKVLTVTSTIFIPLSFVAGVYGMNFEHMPELASTWGYPAVLAGMALAAGAMLLAFRRRGWIGTPRGGRGDG